MEVIKPLWLAHAAVGAGGRKSGQASSIFSVSLDAAGTRLATGGLDCTVRVWHTSAFSTPSPMADGGDSPTLAAVMSRHTGAVLCVRWSPATTPKSLLASAADDSLILIWQRAESQFINAAFEAAASGSDACPTESYSVLHRLTGHESDVNGLEWSADGKYLASCGLDGSVIIWDVSNNYLQVRRLEAEPKKPLKGLVWDPLGQFLAAQSNDGVLFVWRCVDWKLDTTLTSPYADPVESYTYFSRPSWSPDGQVVCIPDAVNESETVAMLVERSQWSIENCLVGHVSSVQTTKFSPRMYRDASGVTFLLIALGSQDGVVSLWSSIASKPLMVLAGLFEHAIMDLAWSADGRSFYAVSYDGTSSKILIDEDTINGAVLSEEEQAALRGKLERHPAGSLALPTSVNQVALHNRLDAILQGKSIRASTLSREQPCVLIPPRSPLDSQATTLDSLPSPCDQAHGGKAAASLVTAASTANAGASSPQIESRLKNGKRRITPQLLQPATPIAGTLSGDKPRPPTESYTVVIGRPARKSWLRAVPIKGTQILQAESGGGGGGVRSEATDTTGFTIEIANVSSRDASAVKISRLQGRKVIWEDRLDGLATCAVLTECGLLLLGLTTHKLVIVTQAGRRLMPPITLAATPTVLARADDICAAVLDNGMFYIWRLPNFRCIICDELPTSGLGSELSHCEVRLLESGDVTLEFEFADGKGLLYSHDRRMFFDVEGPQTTDIILRSIWAEAEEADDAFDPTLIPQILATDTRELLSRTLAHIEAQIAASQLRGDTTRLVPWLCAYAQRLALEENYEKAAEIVSSLRLEQYGRESREALQRTLAVYFATSASAMIRRLADELCPAPASA